jgi:hypothetical protein
MREREREREREKMWSINDHKRWTGKSCSVSEGSTPKRSPTD